MSEIIHGKKISPLNMYEGLTKYSLPKKKDKHSRKNQDPKNDNNLVKIKERFRFY